MRKLYIITAFLIAISHGLFSQSVVLKVREKAFLGLGTERFMRISFSVEGAREKFTDVDVAKGQYYYFFCVPEGDWKVDEKFAEEFAHKILIQQGGNIYYPEIYDIITEGGGTGILIGFEKKFKIEKPFKVSYPISEKVVSSDEMKVPESLWEGYSKNYKAYQEGLSFYNAKNYVQAANAFFNVVVDTSAKKFSFYSDSKDKCIKSLDQVIIGLVERFNSVVSQSAEPEEKIEIYDSLRTAVKNFAEQVLTPKLNVLADTIAFSILSRANDYLGKISNEIEAEKFRLDVKNISWVNTERGTNFKYQVMISALAYAFTSESFWNNPDTSKYEFVLPDTILANLRVFGLEKDYNIFQRVSISNFKLRRSLFTEDFMLNLAKNSNLLPQPYYDIFSAVNSYLLRDYSSCKNYIQKALKSLTDDELIRRVSSMWSMIFVVENNLSLEAVSLYRDGVEKLTKGDKTGGLDALRRAVLIEPRFPLANYAIGEMYFKDGDFYPAIIYITKSISLDPKFIIAYKLLFEIYKSQGNWNDAKNLMESAISNGNDCWIVQVYLGYAYNELKLFDQAIDALKKAISYNPLNYEQYVYLGTVYMNVKNFAEARATFKKAAEINPDRREAIDGLKKLDEIEKTKK